MSNADLSLNFAPVTLKGDSLVNIGYRSFHAAELQELRSEFSGTHVFRRDGRDNTILDIPVVAGHEPLSDKVMEIDLAREFRLWPLLLDAALIRAFHTKREIVRDYPVQILGNEKLNLIKNPALPDWVQKRTLQEFTSRNLFSEADRPHFGLVCDVRIRNILRGSCQELIERGIQIVGQYVVTDVPPRDDRLMPRTLLIGRVQRIDDGYLILEDHRDGYETISAADARLQLSLIHI